ncbi:TfuA-related McrA-glycine thioamidation protein [Methanobacterium oryzae]|uniref:TfuA-related McrA-glycine thioamidation protein n=1 Tax=Methanobacterium oryzae TaxID=69540 RepID=UPI003D20ED55
MLSKKKIIIFTGPSLHGDEARNILDADYRPPIKRGDIITALNDNPDIIGIIDGVFHQQPAVSHREILAALKKDIIIVGGASMGALRASELDDFGMIGIGYVYNQYKDGLIESDDDVAVTINPINLEQLSEPLVSMEYNFKRMVDNDIISKEEFSKLLEVAKSIYYPKRTYNHVFNNVDIEKEKIDEINKFLDEHGVNIKKQDAIDVIKYIKSL